MICEFRNNLEKYNCYVMGEDPKSHISKETYLSDVIITIFLTLSITIFVTWWILPLRNINLNPKFVCNKYKKE